MPYIPPPDIAALSLPELAEAVAARKLPPVAEWSPSESSDSHMQIDEKGRWYHEGAPITRAAMIRAFASLLMRSDDGSYWLMTPMEKQSIAVADAPFIAVDMTNREGVLAFRTNTDELVLAGPDHPLRVDGTADHPAHYVMVRNGCEARLNRSTWEQLACYAEQDDAGWFVASQGARFALMPA